MYACIYTQTSTFAPDVPLYHHTFDIRYNNAACGREGGKGGGGSAVCVREGGMGAEGSVDVCVRVSEKDRDSKHAREGRRMGGGEWGGGGMTSTCTTTMLRLCNYTVIQDGADEYDYGTSHV